MSNISLTKNKFMAFSSHYQMYNWFYPLDSDLFGKRKESLQRKNFDEATRMIQSRGINTRALYFHIPFCETMCSFCPFVKGGFQDRSEVDEYVDALLVEISLKAMSPNVASVPIDSIFFGGGTPSILSPAQIEKIGQAISDHFDLNKLNEFSFEVEAKSTDDERVDALQSIGVTHGRFGFQTFNQNYRRLFTLTATVEQCREAAQTLGRYLPFVSFDILYGMDGQDFDQMAQDLELAVQVGTGNIDVYPVNNVVTQLELHRGFMDAGLEPLSFATKLAMRGFADDVMRENGFLPHNGHGYVRSHRASDRNIITTDEYRFRYHDAVYGYADSDFIGFGSSAVTVNPGGIMTNPLSRKRYVKSIQSDKDLTISIRTPEVHEYPTRAVNGCLPYHGRIAKDRVDWERVHPETIAALDICIQAGLVKDEPHDYSLTRNGWLWYVNLMHFLTPSSERQVLDDYVTRLLEQKDRRDGITEFANLFDLSA